MKKNIHLTLIISGTLLFQGLGNIAHADIVIDGQTYTNAWIQTEGRQSTVQYINDNLVEARRVLQNADEATKQAVVNAWNSVNGTQYTTKTGMEALGVAITQAQTSATDLESWAKNNGGLNLNRGPNWQEISTDASPTRVSQYQLKAWMKATKPSVQKLFESMKALDIKVISVEVANQEVKLYTEHSGDMIYVFNLASPAISSKTLYQSGLLGNISDFSHAVNSKNIFGGGNLSDAWLAGWIPLGVVHADRCRVNTGGTSDEAIAFSQKNLDDAQRYSREGYWGPNDSGVMDIEFIKAGYVTGAGLERRYSYPAKANFSLPVGEDNIATTNESCIYRAAPGTGGTGSGTTVTVTSPLKVNTKTIINNWITAKIVSKKSTMSAVEYQSFLAGVNSKMNTLKTGTTNVQKINILDYIMAQVTLLQKSN